MPDREQIIIKARVAIRGIDPPIWRPLLLRRDLNLTQLHEILQAAFGWTDSHMHEFIIAGRPYGPAEFEGEFEGTPPIAEATETQLWHFSFYPDAPRFLDLYDFGDSWIHEITFETLVQAEPGVRYPMCAEGARHGPPEDVGGMSGYERFLEAWRDPDHEGHKAVRRWAGRRFDPDAFNIEAINKAIASALRKCKGDYRFRFERRCAQIRHAQTRPASRMASARTADPAHYL